MLFILMIQKRISSTETVEFWKERQRERQTDRQRESTFGKKIGGFLTSWNGSRAYILGKMISSTRFVQIVSGTQL